ncbi:MAG: hypothetical protein COA79_18355 [Planctomycetota bacterium]|nr:MAG: hypothetical protein COA79_18355 [Planctomycetota bacterium]
MIFPLIPFGYQENIPVKELNAPIRLVLNVATEPKIATIDIKSDLTIRKIRGKEQFFNEDQKLKKKPITDFISISTELKQAIKNRFDNKNSTEIQFKELLNKTPIIVKLRTYETRDDKPSKIRLYIQKEDENNNNQYVEEIIYFTNLQPVSNTPKIFKILSPEQKSDVLKNLEKRVTVFNDAIYLENNGVSYKFSFDKTDVFYPYGYIKGHPCGLDEAGRDVLTQLIYAFRISISFGILLVVFTITLGILFGSIQGYFGGKVDLFGQRLIEIWSALPFLYIMILLGDSLGRSFTLLLIVYGVLNWIGISYYMRAEFLRLRKTSYVEAAKCLGLSNFTIMKKHILPNALVPIITFFPFMLVGAIGALAALDYLGFGLPFGTPSFGELLRQAQGTPSAWWLILYPSVALFVIMLLGTMIGDGIRAAFDPRKFNKIE